MSDDKWGVGDKADAKAFGTAMVGDTPVELIWGEHPHSRRDDNTYARFPDGSIEAFSGHRVRVRVEVEESNYMKTSYYDEVRRSCVARIFFNDAPVYEIGGRDAEPLLHRAAAVLPTLQEHVAMKEGRWDCEGRKVYYHGVPAIIRRVIADQGCVIIEAESGTFPRQPWEHDDPDPDPDRSVKDDILSPHIWWHRDE